MLNAIRKVACVAVTVAVLIGNKTAFDDDVFKSSDLLMWEQKNRDFYVDTAVGMAAAIAAQNKDEQATCLNNWYFTEKDSANQYVYGVMKKFPDYHPMAVILASIEKKCGTMTY